ncbi:RHS repeat-associated core domain-containing protein [Permianibacter aggregans]|nr:RHS repeat-associated core domain-containing protein [Permianibacter aggregans]
MTAYALPAKTTTVRAHPRARRSSRGRALSGCWLWEKSPRGRNCTSGRIEYNYFRNYDPVTGRYIESDPIGLSDGVNTYGYVQQMPTQLKDPLGLFCVPMWDSESDWMDIGVRIYTGKYKVQPNTAGMMGWCNWKREYKVKQSRTVTARELCFECSDTCEGSDCGYAVKERKKSKEYRDHIDWERGDTTQQHVFGRFASGEGCCKNPWTGVMSCGPI